MEGLIIPKGYKSKTDIITTEKAIKFVKDNFERILAEKLNLIRVSAPLLVLSNTGLNDDLNGVERAVRFELKHLAVKMRKLCTLLQSGKELLLKNTALVQVTAYIPI